MTPFPTPWTWTAHCAFPATVEVLDANNTPLFSIPWKDGEASPEALSLVDRIVACVNAMQGIDDPEEFMEAFHQYVAALRACLSPDS